MGYYMSELYRRYFRATDFSELEEEIENTRQEVRDCLDQAQRRELMRLVDAQDQLKANLAQASFEAKRNEYTVSRSAMPILWEHEYRSGLAARRGAGDLQKTRPAGQPAAVSDLPPLRCCALPVRSRTSQIPRCKIRAQKLRRKTKIRLWG